MRNSDYKNLYKLQDSFLHWMAGRAEPFYLTGGTALSRFYLHHRYSDDLDFFANQYQDFIPAVQRLIREMPIEMLTDKGTLLITADFCRFFIEANGQMLKIEFVNDVLARAGESTLSEYGLVDNPANILANKITAIAGRDEPKDVFDIITLASHYAFDWPSAMYWAKQKAAINELDIENRLLSFPLDYFNEASWLVKPVNRTQFDAKRIQICNDILRAETNSLGIGKTPIMQAQIELISDLD